MPLGRGFRVSGLNAGAALAMLFEGELFRLYSDENRPRRAPFWTPMHLDLSLDFRVLTFAAPVEAREKLHQAALGPATV